MKLFGRYLVDEGVISEDVLLQGLVEQIKTTPSVAEVIYQYGILEISTQLEIMELQASRGNSFIEAAKELNGWSEAVEGETMEKLKRSRQPLGQVLVKMGAVNFSKLTTSLDDFMVEFEDEIKAEGQGANNAQAGGGAGAIKPPVGGVAHVVNIGVSDNSNNRDTEGEAIPQAVPSADSEELRATDLGFGFLNIDASMVESYADLMTVEDREEYETMIKGLSDDINTFSSLSSKFVDRIAESKAGARFIKAEMSVFMYTMYEELIVAICNGPGVFSVDDIEEIRTIMLDLLEEIWNVKLTLCSLNCELPYWETPNSRNRFLGIRDLFQEKISTYSGVPLEQVLSNARKAG